MHNRLAHIITEVKITAKLAAPLVVSQVLQVGMGFIDLIMIGRLGPNELAAGGLGATLWSFIVISAMGLLMALSPLIAQLAGAGRRAEIGRLFQQGWWLALCVGMGAFAVTYHADVLLGWFDIDAEIVPLTHSYLFAVAWGMPAACIYFTGRFVSEGLSNTRPIMLIQVLALCANAFANYLLIYGNFGAPRLGVAGAGWATSLVLCLDALCILLYLRYKRDYAVYAFFSRFTAPDVRALLRVLRLSIPIAVTLMMELGLFTVVALLMGHYGAAAVAAHQAAVNYAALMYMVPLGLSMAVTVRIGLAMGAGQVAAARFRGTVGIAMAMLFMLGSATVMLLFPQAIMTLYSRDDAVIATGIKLLLAGALFQLSDGLQAVGAACLRGLKDTSVPMLAVTVAYWFIGFPAAWLAGVYFQIGPVGLWLGLICGLSFAALFLNIRFYRLIKRYLSERAA